MSEVVIASNITQKIEQFSSSATYTTNSVIYTATANQYIEIDLVHVTGAANYELQIVSPLNVVYTIISSSGMSAATLIANGGATYGFPGSTYAANVVYSSANTIEKLKVPPGFYLAYITNTPGSPKNIYITGTAFTNSP